VVVAVAIIGLVNTAPVLWGAATSIRPASEIFSFPPKFLLTDVIGQHYSQVLGGSFIRNLLNSLAYSTVATVAALLLGSLAAFAFDRIQFPMRKLLFGVIVACIPLSVWILKGAMEGIPQDLDEAATLDGCSRIRTFTSVILPLTRPSLAAAAIFVFIGAWNEFVAGSVMVTTPDYRPVQVAVYQFISAFGRQWGPLTASAILALLPIIVLIIFFGRYLVAGLMRGAVKG
jgi:multiple sugar transport system permease protein